MNLVADTQNPLKRVAGSTFNPFQRVLHVKRRIHSALTIGVLSFLCKIAYRSVLAAAIDSGVYLQLRIGNNYTV